MKIKRKDTNKYVEEYQLTHFEVDEGETTFGIFGLSVEYEKKSSLFSNKIAFYQQIWQFADYIHGVNGINVLHSKIHSFKNLLSFPARIRYSLKEDG